MIKFSIHNWALWDLAASHQFNQYPDCYQGKPELTAIKPMVKRRMPPIAQAIKQLDGELGSSDLPTVFVSKHGELSRTMKIIRQFGGDLSPALFSMSVHNAIAGLLSVINADNSVYTVIDSMSGVLEMALIESVGMLTQHQQVKLVYFDEPTPNDLLSVNPGVDLGLVLMMVVEAGEQYTLSVDKTADQPQVSNVSNNNIFDYLNLFTDQQNTLTMPQSRFTWQWRKC